MLPLHLLKHKPPGHDSAQTVVLHLFSVEFFQDDNQRVLISFFFALSAKITTEIFVIFSGIFYCGDLELGILYWY
jgi:hypothetical protein